MIYEKGCIQAGEEWVERNLLAIVTGAVATAFAQVYFIIFQSHSLFSFSFFFFFASYVILYLRYTYRNFDFSIFARLSSGILNKLFHFIVHSSNSLLKFVFHFVFDFKNTFETKMKRMVKHYDIVHMCFK